MTFDLRQVNGMVVSDEDLIADLRAVALVLNKERVGCRVYQRLGKYSWTTLRSRFGSWNKALEVAGLVSSPSESVTEERLFENLLVLWQHYGRQPRRRELAEPPSVISQTPYNRHFGSWLAALRAFVEYANAADASAGAIGNTPNPKRQQPRDPSLRLRFQVLNRDHFKCVACGASPALVAGVELQIDHVVPWSKGGYTVLENLQTLCGPCNLGKSNTL